MVRVSYNNGVILFLWLPPDCLEESLRVSVGLSALISPSASTETHPRAPRRRQRFVRTLTPSSPGGAAARHHQLLSVLETSERSPACQSTPDLNDSETV